MDGIASSEAAHTAGVSTALPPLMRVAINHHDPHMVVMRDGFITDLVNAVRHTLQTDDKVQKLCADAGIASVALGGSASLITPRHPQDIDLYLAGDYDVRDTASSSARLQAVRTLLAHATASMNATIDHVYVRDEESKAPGLQKIGLQAYFPASAAYPHPVYMPVKVEVHHEREKCFLPETQLPTRYSDASDAGPDAAPMTLRALDPRMVIVQKLIRFYMPGDWPKGTDFLDISHAIDTGAFDPNDPLMRKMLIACLASEGVLRAPLTLDFLVPRQREQEIAMLREDLEMNISHHLMAKYDDAALGHMIDSVRDAARRILPMRMDNATLAVPQYLQDAAELTAGEQDFIDGIFTGKRFGAGSPVAMVQAERLFDGAQPVPTPQMLEAVRHDTGIKDELQKTRDQLQSARAMHKG